MVMRAAILILVFWQCGAGADETNCLFGGRFTLPSLELRGLTAQKESEAILPRKDESPSLGAIDLGSGAASLKLSKARTETAPKEQFSLSTRLSEREMQVYRRLEEGGYLTRP